jgi:hypothetical protein
VISRLDSNHLSTHHLNELLIVHFGYDQAIRRRWLNAAIAHPDFEKGFASRQWMPLPPLPRSLSLSAGIPLRVTA